MIQKVANLLGEWNTTKLGRNLLRKLSRRRKNAAAANCGDHYSLVQLRYSIQCGTAGTDEPARAYTTPESDVTYNV